MGRQNLRNTDQTDHGRGDHRSVARLVYEDGLRVQDLDDMPTNLVHSDQRVCVVGRYQEKLEGT